MKIERNYLTANEIRYIANMISEIDDYMTKQYIKYLTVADFCTDYKLETEKSEDGKEDSVVWKEDNYNKLWEEGNIEVLDKEIKNIYLIDKAVEDRQSTYNMFRELTEKLSESIKNFDINETKTVINQIGSLINKEEK